MATGFIRWYLTNNGEQVGPYSITALFHQLGTGAIGPGEWVWPEGVDAAVTVQRFLKRVHDETLPRWRGGPPPVMELSYHIRGKEKTGPFGTEKLMELAAAGELSPDELLWRHDAKGWTHVPARRVIAFPPARNLLPLWMKDVARAEKVALPEPVADAQLPTWMDDQTRTELAATPKAGASALPDWMQGTPPEASPAKPVPPSQVAAQPDWLDCIREIDEALRRRLIMALAKRGSQMQAAGTPPSGTLKVAATVPTAQALGVVPTAEAVHWPVSADYNEAIQTPAQCFADPELRQGVVVTSTLGLPVAFSGNFADVYAVQTVRRKVAVKCFTRQIVGLRERYIEISKHMKKSPLPFVVEFEFLEQGIRVRGGWYPILKMQWVEGVALNAYVRSQLDNPQTLDKLSQTWVMLAVRLRRANLAHGDLQHGNVLIVPNKQPGSFRVRLVDYDGMCVPALELLKPIEVGHTAFQHPQRLRESIYGLQIDRFSHLVIYTALRSLIVGGRRLWDKYDNGDNLLFTPKDFQNPRASPLFQELVRLDNPGVKGFAQTLAIASQKPLEETPLLADPVALGSGQTSTASGDGLTIGL